MTQCCQTRRSSDMLPSRNTTRIEENARESDITTETGTTPELVRADSPPSATISSAVSSSVPVSASMAAHTTNACRPCATSSATRSHTRANQAGFSATGATKVWMPARPTGIVRMVERSEEHTSELQSLMRISYAAFCLKKQKDTQLT